MRRLTEKFPDVSCGRHPGILAVYFSQRRYIDKKAAIYIRRGTSDELVDEQELSGILKRRNQHMFPATGEPLKLQEHLNQLNTLYKNIKPTITTYKTASGIGEAVRGLAEIISVIVPQREEKVNPLYPDETYEEFIANMIEKKNKNRKSS